jgi:integrase
MKPQTVNGYIRAARAVFEYMLRNGIIAENVFDRVKNIRVTARDRKTHGCYGLEKLAGVFDEEWEDRRSYMLSLLVYTTNMRNSEIERVRLKDIVEMDGCHFVSIPESKTESGERLVPLHPFTRRAMLVWAAETGKGPEDRLFLSGRKRNQSGLYRKAYLDMAARLGVDAERLRAENITYYSGRHFWKTLMSAEDLGDVEECFMGHKVTGNVKKLYDHKDKRGRDRMVKKARQVIGALDRCLFGGGPAENRAETLDTGEC